VCFSDEQLREHECFDMRDKLDAEIAACKFETEWRKQNA
jgi:hypothetical protein